MKKCRIIISLLLAVMMLASVPAFAADTVVNDTYYKNLDYEGNSGASGYITENGNTFKNISTTSETGTAIERYIVNTGFTPTQNIVIKFDFRITAADSADTEKFIASVTCGNELKLFKLDGTDIKYCRSKQDITDSGLDASLNEWHSVAIEYSMLESVSDDSVSYTKTYDLYYDGVLIADDVADNYTTQTANTYTRITLWATNAPEESPVQIDNVQFFDGTLDSSGMISFNDTVVFKASKLLVDRDAEIAKADITAALNGGVLEGIYTDAALTAEADKVTDGCTALIKTSDGKFAHIYELTSDIFEEDFDGNSALNETIQAGSTRSLVKIDASDYNSEIIYDTQHVIYALASSADKSLTQTDADKYCAVTTGTSVVNDGYPRIDIASSEAVFPLTEDFTTEMSVYMTGGAAHGIDVRLSSGSLSLGGETYDFDKYNLNSWNKISIRVDIEADKVTASLYVNGKYVRQISKSGENLYCTSIRYFSHPLNKLSPDNIREIYNANGNTIPEELLGKPVEFDDAIDNIRIYKGAHDGTEDVSEVNPDIPVKDGKVYADLADLSDFASDFAGDSLVRIVNSDGTAELKEGSVILVKSVSGDFWNAYTVTDAAFRVISFTKNSGGTNAIAVLNNHTTEPVLLVAAIYNGNELITMQTMPASSGEDLVTLAAELELSEGQSAKFMLLDSFESLIPYCTIAQ